ncbi:MAG: protein phosphatase 2C domain-containing protein [Candidatus Eisenbacteria bacterium]|uniref:Protein phosphatase 2C domain-containing protein n=1 Tax=Eiseniibacteriota bacterium TaxID=2212470 RepID=A0A948W524_UNCEI|nr:protein phosphatase 2C domain-containing protein [Candidatus Eisenbacteria bacterium]MBU1949252.1 protein phosphatase 2C domain-containing protein [Candidatus Eisenbacteria bacterium]MBU2689590.1 protein phosphatase 2C domain-containing protein [Candidatus Eisenbacteria bacterium]
MALKIEWGFHTDRGQVRSKNEDSCLTWYATKSAPPIQAIFAVADGMGGHPGGDQASRLAVKGLEKILTACKIFPLGEASAIITQTFQEVHAMIRKGMEDDPKLSGMGTTLTALIMAQDHLYAGHVGDSRLYALNLIDTEPQVTCLTKDHTLAYEQMEAGVIDSEDLETHPLSHVLTRSIGAGDVARVDTMDLGPAPAEERDYLICSDGLIRVVHPREFAGIVKGKSPEKAARALVNIANERGAPDNITVILVHFGTAVEPQKV